MPELPEVEVVRRGLETHVAGRSLKQVIVEDSRSLKRHTAGPRHFVDRLTDRQIAGVERRGKYLWWKLDDGASVVVHLGMSGQVLVSDAKSDHRHLRLWFVLDNGRVISFVDQRIFGGMFVDETNPPAAISHIALDPLDPEFDREQFAGRLASKSVGIKKVLLDQNVVSGIGNIYADEALWRAQVHYAQAANSLPREQALELLDHARDVMVEALDQGGTSFDSLYVNVQGESGYFARSLEAYGRAGEPCSRCGTSIVRETFMNRGSHFCPSCQRREKVDSGG